MFIFDNKTNILINSNELTFKSEYHCEFARYFQMREFIDQDALQLGGDHFEGYLSKLITDQVMLELSQRNCLTKIAGVTHSKMWVFGIPVQRAPILLHNLYQLQNNYIGIIPPQSEYSLFQNPFSNRFHLYINDDCLNQLCQTLGLPEAKKFLNYSDVSGVICSPKKISHLQQLCHQLYEMAYALDCAEISFERKALKLNFMKQKLKEEIVKKFILTLAEAKQIKPKKIVIKRTSILKQAEEMMRNNLRSDLTIPAICQELGVSQRTLEYIFKDFYEISPNNYFKKLRLNALYRHLQQRTKSELIYDIAEDFGFFHRGQLAQDYSQLFGELPSKTLAKVST